MPTTVRTAIGLLCLAIGLPVQAHTSHSRTNFTLSQPADMFASYEIVLPSGGKREVGSGQPVTLPIEDGTYKVSFFHSLAFCFEAAGGTVGRVTNCNGADVDALEISGTSLTFKAVKVTVDPGSTATDRYVGSYKIASFHDTQNRNSSSGRTDFNLVRGLAWYALALAHGTGFRFDLHPTDARITRIHDEGRSPIGAATVSNDTTLRFNTVEIEIDADGYRGEYKLRDTLDSAGDDWDSGDRVFRVLPDLRGYAISLGPGSGFRFDVLSNGNLGTTIRDESGAPIPAATTNTNVLTFATTRVVVHTEAGPRKDDDFRGEYSITNVPDNAGRERATGKRKYELLRGVAGYTLNLGPSAAFRFDVLANKTVGNVRSAHHPHAPVQAAVADGNKLRFATQPLEIDPSTSTPYKLDWVESAAKAGARTVWLVQDIEQYALTASGAAGRFDFRVGAPPDPSQIVLGTDSFTLRRPVANSRDGGVLHGAICRREPGACTPSLP